MVSAKQDRKYPCAYCSVPPDTAHRRQHYREKSQMMLFAPKSPKNSQVEARVHSTCKRQLFQIQRQMCKKESRWRLIFPAQIHCTWLLKAKIYSWLHPAHPSSLVSALSLKEQALHGIFFQNESQAYFWVNSYNFAPHSAVQVSRFCWLLDKGMISPEHPGLYWEKFLSHLLCGCCRVCRQKGRGAGQK